MATKRSGSQQQYLQSLTHRYMDEHCVDAVDLADVARWAYDNGLWRDRPYDPVKNLRRLLARAAAAEYIHDPQGREVRGMIPIPIKSDDGQLLWEWAPIYRASRKDFHLSQQVRRNGILAGCRQHKIDTDSYNDNNLHGAFVDAFDYNFNPDLEEESFPTDYPDEAPDSD